MIAFVAGATGYTGRAVVEALRRRGVETIAHVRPDSPRLPEWRVRFEGLGAQVDATPWELAALRERLVRARPAVVFALLGTTRARAREAAGHGERADYEAVDYGLTHLLLEAARACASRPRFVYLSSVGVREGTRNRYLAARARAEREVRESGLPWLIARPSFITGPDREESRPLERAGAAVSDAALALAARLGLGGLAERYRSTTGAALAETLVARALDTPAAESAVLEGAALRA